MSKSQDYIPKSEPALVSFLDNVVVKLPGYANDFKMNVIDTDVPFFGDVEAGKTVIALYGRFPDIVTIRFNNSGTVPLNISSTINADSPLMAPITNLLAGATIDLDILTMGGPGRPFIRIENPSLTTDGSYTLYTTRLGGMIHSADSIIRAINLTTQMRTDYLEQVEKKDAVKQQYIRMLRDEFQDMKKDKKFTPAAGDDLDIISGPKIIDVATSKPDLEGKRVPTGWEISFSLLNYFDGITINRKRPSDAGFSFWRQRSTGTPVTDTEPMVNGTQYQAYFMIGEDLVGQPSTILTISV